MIALPPTADFWSGWQPATCLPDGCFCEAIRPGVIAQPANCVSSLAFVLVGMVVWAQARRNVYRRLYALTLLLVGAGSAFYHGSLTFAGQVVDMTGMYALVTFAILYAAARRRAISSRVFALCFLAVNPLLAWFQVEFPDARRYVFAALAVVLLMAEGRARSPHLMRALLIFAGGFAVWTLDKTHVACAPYSPLQGHAIWHLAGAAAAWFLYAHSRESFGLTNQIK